MSSWSVPLAVAGPRSGAWTVPCLISPPRYSGTNPSDPLWGPSKPDSGVVFSCGLSCGLVKHWLAPGDPFFLVLHPARLESMVLPLSPGSPMPSAIHDLPSLPQHRVVFAVSRAPFFFPLSLCLCPTWHPALQGWHLCALGEGRGLTGG